MKIHEQEYLSNIEKQRSIKAFERLSALVFQKGWNAGRLYDRTFAGLLKCIKTWMQLHDFRCTEVGNIIEAKNGKETIVIELATTGYSTLSPAQQNLKSTITKNADTYLVVRNLYDFLEKYDHEIGE